MKKPFQILVLITVAFAAFVFGFFSGRNLNRTPVQIQQVPAVSQSAPTGEEPSPTQAPTGPVIVNINTADLEELDTLPGIGPVIAQRIIDYREQYGLFEKPGELLNVKGIGEATLEEIWDLITIGG